MYKKTFTFILFFCLMAFGVGAGHAQTAVPSSPSVVTVNGKKLMVQKRLSSGSLAAPAVFTIKGVTWDPATAAPLNGPNPLGLGNVQYGFFFDWPGRTPQGFEILDYWKKSQFAAHAPKDLPLIAQMNANAIRVYSPTGNTPAGVKAVLDTAYREGIMVVMTIATARAELDNQSYLTHVLQYKDHPAILMWALGNEWNFNLYYGYGTAAEAIAATNAAAAAIKNADPFHPVSSSLGDRFSSQPVVCDPMNPCCGSPPALSDIPSIVNGAPHVDVWGLNIYRGSSFGTLFDQWQAASNKPFYIGEFGVDAFDSTSFSLYGCGIAAQVSGAVNQGKQARFDIGLWHELASQLSEYSTHGSAVGGFIHQFNDAIWKAGSYHSGLGGIFNYDGPDQIAGTADDDKSFRKYNSDGFLIVGGFPDHVANEEYFGIVNSGRSKRLVYTYLQDLYTHLPNIVLNPGFEQQKSQWSGSTSTVDCTVKHSGACSLKFNSIGSSTSTPSFRVMMGKPYEVSGWIKTAFTSAPKNNHGARFRIQWLDYSEIPLFTEDINIAINGVKDWQAVSKQIIIPDQAAFGRITCFVNGQVTGSAWFDDISVRPIN